MRRLAAAAAATVLACTTEGPARVEVGLEAPSYATRTLAGDSVSLALLRGKPVLLNVWATWCLPCKEEIPYLESLHAQHAADGLQIVGVSVDARGDEAKIEAFARDFRMTYPIWRDPDERVNARFLAIGVPSTYLIDRDGILRWKHLGTLRPSTPGFTDALAQVLRD
ncbi:MAG: TlpA family protein disulfide reductase [Gemmatimonadaceae bacterium]|nr:TlpA family protein disulfide reductase [Gemmatimonadaceae bacterium]